LSGVPVPGTQPDDASTLVSTQPGLRESPLRVANTSSLAPLEVSEANLVDGTALDELLEEARRHVQDADLGTIERAYRVATKAHAEQRRKSGEPYLVHPVRVARTIAQLGMDTPSIVAGLLHDAVEDSELTAYEIGEEFGRTVATIVDGVTKLGKVPYLSRQEQQAESFRKMLVAMSEDIRVLLVKLIDRLDNMRTLQHMPRDKQERISRETMQIYAPLAGRLGIEWVRSELQDLSFRYLEPTVYLALESEIARIIDDRPELIDETVRELRSAFEAQIGSGDTDERTPWPLDRLGPVDVRATLRPPYRVHRRLEVAGRGVDQLADVVTFQIVTRDRASCYAALGQIHANFQPVPGRFRDYVALPRPNRYRALHTSVIDRHGNRLELQIRSERMDAIAERGIVADWERGDPIGYQLGSRIKATGSEARRLAWLSHLMDWQQDVTDPSEFIEAVKADLFADEVYVFTPRGDIYTFPKGATPIDFSFAIHTDVGMHCSGARVNGHVVPLRYRLRQGDTVEILTNPDVGPREEWLKMCVSSRARARIKQTLRQRERERLRTLGRSLLEQELATRGQSVEEIESRGDVATLVESLGLGKDRGGVDGVYEAIGAGQLGASLVADRLRPSQEEDGLISRVLRRMAGRAGRSVTHLTPGGAPLVVTRERVVGHVGGDAMIQLAPCCSPVPGDPLVGFFEAGRGIEAHVQGCPEALAQVSEQRIPLAWEDALALPCPVTLEVRTGNAVGLLAEMSRAFSHHGVNIKQANCRATGDGDRAINTFHATVDRLEQLDALIATLKAIPGVTAVERVFTQGSGVYPR
jgi:GTP diphosphokinase / guanosine-3',5'-bis(diphosphate) 3'-diphosphatase